MLEISNIVNKMIYFQFVILWILEIEGIKLYSGNMFL